MNRTLIRLLSLFLALGLVAAACGSDDEATTPGDSTDATTGDSGGDGILRLGGILPETGNLAFLGPPEFAGVQAAVADINAAGGVLDKITQAGKVHFSPANTSPTFTDYADNGLYFRSAPSDVVQGAALADIMLSDGAETASFLVLNDAYGTGLLEFTKGPYEANGGTVGYEVVYDPQAENFDAEVSAAIEANTDAIVIIGFDETSKILTGLIEGGAGPSEKLIYGTDGNMGNALAAAFDDPSVVAGMRGTLPGVDVEGELSDFRDKLLGIDPALVDYSYSAESYDAVVIIALAAIAAGSDDGVAIGAQINDVTRGGEKCTTFADCKALADAGTDLDYDGLSGPLEFIDAGEPSQASILILEYDETGAIFVDGSVEGSL